MKLLHQYMLAPREETKGSNVSFMSNAFYNVSFCTGCFSDATLFNVPVLYRFPV